MLPLGQNFVATPSTTGCCYEYREKGIPSAVSLSFFFFFFLIAKTKVFISLKNPLLPCAQLKFTFPSGEEGELIIGHMRSVVFIILGLIFCGATPTVTAPTHLGQCYTDYTFDVFNAQNVSL